MAPSAARLSMPDVCSGAVVKPGDANPVEIRRERHFFQSFRPDSGTVQAYNAHIVLLHRLYTMYSVLARLLTVRHGTPPALCY